MISGVIFSCKDCKSILLNAFGFTALGVAPF